MADLNRFLVDNLWAVVAFIGLLVAVLVVVVVTMTARLREATEQYRALVDGTDGGAIEEVLTAHIQRVGEVSRQLYLLAEQYRALRDRAEGSLQHIGMVRFNPFDDTGSDQSFAIALLDDRRDGIVISSLHGRNVTRIFAKPIEAGTSRHSLSGEEVQAIQIALEGTQAIALAR